MVKNVTYQVSFRVVTFWTEYKFSDESIKQVLQFIGSVRSVDDVAVVLVVKLCLCPKLAAKVFRRICNVTTADNVHESADLYHTTVRQWCQTVTFKSV